MCIVGSTNGWTTGKGTGRIDATGSGPDVGTYDFRHAVLLPTRANGPLTNQSKPETIIDYFRGFLKDTPVVEFDKPIVGENYGDAALN